VGANFNFREAKLIFWWVENMNFGNGSLLKSSFLKRKKSLL